jgi:hypothetical protein
MPAAGINSIANAARAYKFVNVLLGNRARRCAIACASPSTRHTSHLTPHTSHLTPHTSHLTPHTSHVTRHTSHHTHHTSHLTPHTSHVTPCLQMFAGCSAGAGCLQDVPRAAAAAPAEGGALGGQVKPLPWMMMDTRRRGGGGCGGGGGGCPADACNRRLVAAAVAIQRAYRDVLDYRWHQWHARPKVMMTLTWRVTCDV